MLNATCFGIVLLVTAILTIFAYHQSDYIIINERTEVVSYNKRLATLAKTANFKYNRTHVGVNYTLNFNADFGYHLEIHVQEYKFASNEYRLFPLMFTFNFCDAVEKDDFGLQNLYHCGNFSKCPLVKGNYQICNWHPDFSKFPPYIPSGSYMVDLKFAYFGVEVLNTQGYCIVKSIKDFAP